MKTQIIKLLSKLFPYQEPRIPMFFHTTNERWVNSIARRGELKDYLYHRPIKNS